MLNKPIINIKYDIKQALSCHNVRPVSFEWIDILEKAHDKKDGKEHEAYSPEEIPEEYQSG